jgi:hypothetical protein
MYRMLVGLTTGEAGREDFGYHVWVKPVLRRHERLSHVVVADYSRDDCHVTGYLQDTVLGSVFGRMLIGAEVPNRSTLGARIDGAGGPCTVP